MILLQTCCAFMVSCLTWPPVLQTSFRNWKQPEAGQIRILHSHPGGCINAPLCTTDPPLPSSDEVPWCMLRSCLCTGSGVGLPTFEESWKGTAEVTMVQDIIFPKIRPHLWKKILKSPNFCRHLYLYLYLNIDIDIYIYIYIVLNKWKI